jgi:hypothetical protein
MPRKPVSCSKKCRFDDENETGGQVLSGDASLIRFLAMSAPLSLVVPADRRYRVLAPELAEKYAELAGGTAADGPALAAAVASAMDTLCPETNAGLQIDLTFRPDDASGVIVEIRCEGRSTTVKHLLSAEKR